MTLAALRRRLVVSIFALASCTSSVSQDAATNAADATSDAPSAAVAQCWASVDALIARCEATTRPNRRRVCTLGAYRDACESGRADVVAAIAQCLLAADPCASARAPGTAASCVTAIVSPGDAAHAALDRAWCACSPSEIGCPDTPALTGPELAMIDDADAASVTACLTSTCSMPTFCYGTTALGGELLHCDMVTP